MSLYIFYEGDLPFKSKEKSLNTHRNCGKYLASSGSSTSV